MPHLAATALCVGLTASNALRLPGTTLAAAAAVVLIGCAVSEESLRRPLLIVGLALAGLTWGGVRLSELDHSVLASRVGMAERSLVEVVAPPHPGRFDTRVRARVLQYGRLRVRENILLVLRPGRVPRQGDVLSLVGILRAPRGPSNGFDERSWLRHNGMHVVMRGEDWTVVGRRRGLGAVQDRLHHWLSADAPYSLSGERRELIEGVVLGETQGLDDHLLGRFRASGLYHVLAVDGLKVTAVAGGAAGLAFFLGAARASAELIALAAVGAYVLAVGAHPSVVRAAIAAGLVSLAWLMGRQRDRWQALLVAAVALLAWNPYSVLDAGFQLSFAAVAGIFTIAPRVIRFLEGYPVPTAVAKVAAVSTACGVATAPVTWVQFHQVSLVTVPANVVGVPVVAEILAVALVTAALAPLLPPVAALLAQTNGIAAGFVAWWARVTGGVPFAQLSSSRALMLLSAGGLAACALVLRRRVPTQ